MKINFSSFKSKPLSKVFTTRNCLVAYFILVSIIAVALAIYVSPKDNKSMSNEEAAIWIAGFTPNYIDPTNSIAVEFTDSMMRHLDLSNSLDNVFSFSPNIKGKTSFNKNLGRIIFEPDEELKPNQLYHCRLKMKKICDMKSLADFAFIFFVNGAEVKFANIKAGVDHYNTHNAFISGRLEYNSSAEKIVSSDKYIIKCDYKGAKITMDNECYDMGRGFKITGIRRSNTAKKIKISVSGTSDLSPIEQTVEIPSLYDFLLLYAERIEAAEPYINLEFSMQLSPQQELDGLITIDQTPDVRIERNGANVKVFYPKNGYEKLTLRVDENVKSSIGKSLDETIVRNFNQEPIPPAVKIPFHGSILPDNQNLKLPFQAVNLAAVDVEVIKIFPANIMSYLQEQELNDCYNLRRYGRLIYRHTVRLDNDKNIDLHQWHDFAIDLKGLFAQEHGAIYNINLSFLKEYSLYDKNEPENFKERNKLTDEDTETWNTAWSYLSRDYPINDWSDYNYTERDDPKKYSYYIVRGYNTPEINIVASNLGIIVKRVGDNEVKATVSDIVTTTPLAGIPVTAYNYQLQKIGSGITDSNGFADFRTVSRPFMVTATDGRSTTYLKVANGYEISTSSFDVSGTTLTDGIKGFTYGDRGVWRPGDDIHLSLIIEDKNKRLPKKHPVVMELYNPDEQLYTRQTLTEGVDGFYVFNIETDENVATGLWTAKFKVGNETFHHPVRIETIKPNRLKINITLPDIIQANKKERIGLNAHWLTGPAAKGMRAAIEMDLYSDPTPFKKYRNYTFNNPIVSYSSNHKELYSGVLDSLGNIVRHCTIGAAINSPGMLRANFTAKVTEPGGDISIATKSVSFSPFGVYVGIDLSKDTFETDSDIKLPVVVLNQVGMRMKERELEYKIYQIDWNWWWQGSNSDFSKYVYSDYANIVSTGSITAINGVAEIPFKVEHPDYGEYLVVVRDTKGGHATGGTFSVDWPDWRGRSDRDHATASTELSFTLDKEQYEVGETANVYLPKCDGGRVLLSIETGSKVLKRMWVPLSGNNDTKYQLRIDRDMAPNFYVSATLLRPHKGTNFDTPIRLFGIKSAKVIDRLSILHPIIEMPDEVHPQKEFSINVREKDNKAMTYTLAIVDEGLLDITNFKTPQPWYSMNKKEALGVKTWDMYDDVIGAFGSSFRSVLSVGGDEALRKAAGKEKRFNPAVKFIGPFTINGGPKTHKITLPNYVGSVRVMIVAAHDGCYGNADKTVKVTSPVMLLSTLPRALAYSDTISMPVNVFAMDEGIKNVNVSIETNGPIKVQGAKSKNVVFDQQGEKLIFFKLACENARAQKARIILTTRGNENIIRDTTYISVSNPMPNILETVEKALAPNERTELTWNSSPAGKVSLQVASLPSINFNAITLFMEYYPHLCTEQLSSKALFMLYGRKFLDEKNREKCEKQLPLIIKAIQSRQLPSGAFTYWMGDKIENEWVTSLAGLALVEASRQGFRTNNECIERWKNYQVSVSREYRHSIYTDLLQSLRLYSLAVANSPQTAAMNRLRESGAISRSAAFCLASAYAETGRIDVATNMIERAEKSEISKRKEIIDSPLLDKAIELEAYAQCGLFAKAIPVAHDISKKCNGSSYVTQDISFATIAMSTLSNNTDNSTPFVKLTQQGRAPISINSINSLENIDIDCNNGKMSVENIGSSTVELSLMNSYQPSPQKTVKPEENGLKMSISYFNMKGNRISINDIKEDSEFTARISVTNYSDDIANAALCYNIPAGWEIWNDRIYGHAHDESEYRDIRDISINYYFAIKRGESKKYEVRLRAAYQGSYLLPPSVCEDMYNPVCRALTANRRVTVSK